MEIKHDRSYLNLWSDQRDVGFTREIADKIVFDADIRDKNCLTAFQEIKDWLEENYKMYQYKKDNGVKYGEHELFYWASWETPDRYFTIDLNDRLSFEKRNELLEQIESYIVNNLSNIGGFIRLQYKNCMDWDLVNEYVLQLEIDYNNIPYDKLRAIFDFQFTSDWKYLAKENALKLYNIQQELLENLEGKKVIYNGIKGTVKKVNNGGYGVFKPRATRTYYPIELKTIKELMLA